jgi:hypothetical protein
MIYGLSNLKKTTGLFKIFSIFTADQINSIVPITLMPRWSPTKLDQMQIHGSYTTSSRPCLRFLLDDHPTNIPTSSRSPRPICPRHTVPNLTPDVHTNKEFLISREVDPEISRQSIKCRSKNGSYKRSRDRIRSTHDSYRRLRNCIRFAHEVT